MPDARPARSGPRSSSRHTTISPLAKLLRRIATCQPAAGGIIAYRSDGHERIAIAAGFESGIYQTTRQPVIFVFGL